MARGPCVIKRRSIFLGLHPAGDYPAGFPIKAGGTVTPTPPSDHEARAQRRQRRRALRRFGAFLLLAAAGILMGLCRPLREFLSLHHIEALVASLGAWGPAVIVALGVLTPVLFLPRWPLCFACGLLYGVAWGTLLPTVASLLGAWLQYALARNLLAHFTQRLLGRFRLAHAVIPPNRSFLALVLLRAFPLSNFSAVNLLAGAMRIRSRVYLLASFLGMLPSSLMYAAWGKFAKKPSPMFLAIALVAMLAIVAVYWIEVQRREPWLPEEEDESERSA